jgi:hypothetical protein
MANNKPMQLTLANDKPDNWQKPNQCWQKPNQWDRSSLCI